MGLLQLYLRAGTQSISLNNNIPKGSLSLKHVHAAFNIENHGFYMITLQLPFMFTNNTQSNISKRGLLIPVNHNSSVTTISSPQRLGEVEIPRNFEVNVDLDNGHQIVLETDTRVGGTYAFNTHSSGGLWADSDYYSGTPTAGAYISIGLHADKVYNASAVAAAATPQEIGTPNVIENTTGVLDGPTPFLYSLILTFEYEDGLIEERLQQLIS